MARKLIVFLAFSFVVVTVTLVAVVLLVEKNTPLPPLPKPNGYDDFARAFDMLQVSNSMVLVPTAGNLQVATNSARMARGVEDPDKMSVPELERYLADKTDVLGLVREGLTKECAVPVDQFSAVGLPLGRLSNSKRVEWLFIAEGKLALLQNRPGDAVQSWIDGIRFAQESARGGVLISRLVGIADESMVIKQLQGALDDLDATNCRTVAQQLEAIDAKAEPIQVTIDEDAAWNRKTDTVTTFIRRVVQFREQELSLDHLRSKDNARVLQRRQVMLAAAARAYQLERGAAPASAAELVPGYLKAVPKDPATGQDMPLPPTGDRK